MAVRDIARVRAPAPGAFVTRYERPRRPVVIEGLADDWPARVWSPARLQARFGDRPLPIARLGADGLMAYGGGDGLRYEWMTYRELRDRLARAPSHYLSVPVAEHCAQLFDDVRTPAYCAGAAWRASRVWIGPPGSCTPIHRELTHNLLVQLRGHKRARLFSPRSSRALYPHAPWSPTPHFSRVHPLRPDARRFPRFAGATAWQCRLAPGDTLFIPRGWWHVVHAEEASVSFNFWWARGAWALLPRAAQLYKRARKLNV
jgi:hypothetical protein